MTRVAAIAAVSLVWWSLAGCSPSPRSVAWPRSAGRVPAKTWQEDGGEPLTAQSPSRPAESRPRVEAVEEDPVGVAPAPRSAVSNPLPGPAAAGPPPALSLPIVDELIVIDGAPELE
jgi:hypothetical protein